MGEGPGPGPGPGPSGRRPTAPSAAGCWVPFGWGFPGWLVCLFIFPQNTSTFPNRGAATKQNEGENTALPRHINNILPVRPGPGHGCITQDLPFFWRMQPQFEDLNLIGSYRRLPVPASCQVKRGGSYAVNQTGKQIWLKKKKISSESAGGEGRLGRKTQPRAARIKDRERV